MHFSFSEILMVLVVALLVIKPERLPEAARTVGRWIGWMRQTSQKIKQEMEKPLDLFSYHEMQAKPQEVKKPVDETVA
jgi:sec-independent protein translocase protein TatB